MIKRFLKSIYTWIILGTIAFLAFFYYLFSWTRTIDWTGNYPIDYEAFGTYGDFIGGVLGTLLSMVSVILVVVTFRHQQEQSKIERLNGIFFELLNLHNNQIEALHYQLLMDEPFSDTCVNGSQGTNGIYSIRNADTKDFFDCVIAEMFTKFKPTLNFYNNGVKAAKLYASNTLYVRSKLSLYYRTIYRILDTISNSDVDIKVKKDYFKLFRAQLTENELIALRYHVNDGRFITFANYINQSHLFKHLHLFSLLEFYSWSTKFSETDISSLNEFFIRLFKDVRKHKKFNSQRFSKLFTISISTPSKSEMVLTLVKKKTQTIDNDDPLRCLYDLDEKSLENLFEGIIKELIFFSNFFLYNNYSRVSLPQPQKEDNKIVFTVNNKDNQALIFTYDEYLKYNSK